MGQLRAEGSRTPAGVIITVDAGNLWRAANPGLLQPLDWPTLQANIPANLRDPQNRGSRPTRLKASTVCTSMFPVPALQRVPTVWKAPAP